MKSDNKQISLNRLFEMCIERNIDAYGTLQIRCKLGNWAVIDPDHKNAESEARHYWRQYFADGDYQDLINEPATPTEYKLGLARVKCRCKKDYGTWFDREIPMADICCKCGGEK